jgi:hypothetical protein
MTPSMLSITVVRAASPLLALLLSGCLYSVGDLVSTGATTSSSGTGGAAASTNLLQNASFEQWSANTGGSPPLAWEVDGCDLTRSAGPVKPTDGVDAGKVTITTDFGRLYQDVYFDPPLVTPTLEAGIDIAYQSGDTTAPPTLTLLLRFHDGAPEEDPFQGAIWHVDGSWVRGHLVAKVTHPIDHLGFRLVGNKAGQTFLIDAASLTAAPGP